MIAFLVKGYKWICQYLLWKKTVINNFLRRNIDQYDSACAIKEAQACYHIDSWKYYTEIVDGLELCKRKGYPYHLIQEADMACVVSPECFEGVQRAVYQFPCPPIYIAEFQEAKVYGYSELISIGETAILDAYVYDKEQKRYQVGGGGILKVHTGKYLLSIYKASNICIENAISMLGWKPDNYYHFTFEIISRLAFADRFIEYRDWPVLVDRSALAIPQLCDLLNSVNECHHPIISVEENVVVQVKHLLYISYNMWMPHNFRTGVQPEPRDYRISQTVVDNIRIPVLRNVKVDKHYSGGRFFLSRKKCVNQRLLNSTEVEQLFRERGFEIIYPEEMSFEDEVNIFRNADIIVGATGAAFTNIVYCKEGAVVAIIAPETHKSYFFSNIAYMVGVKFLFLGADMVEKGMAESTDSFQLDVTKCERFLDELT